MTREKIHQLFEQDFPILFFCSQGVCKSVMVFEKGQTFTEAKGKITVLPRCRHGVMHTAQTRQKKNILVD